MSTSDQNNSLHVLMNDKNAEMLSSVLAHFDTVDDNMFLNRVRRYISSQMGDNSHSHRSE